jgi:epidermal growth factor receptor substrate 15
VAIPTFVAKTAFVNGTTTDPVIDFSTTGCASGDLLIIVAECPNRVFNTPAGFTESASSPQSTGTAGTAGGVRLGVWYKISDGTETTVTLSLASSTDHHNGIGIVLRGVDTTTPIHVSAGSVIATATTAISFPAVTTTINDCLIVNCLANDRDLASTSNLSSVANASLSSVTLRHDQTVSTDSGGGVAIITGGLATAGSSGSTTATNAASNVYAMVTLAVTPAAGTTVSASGSDAASASDSASSAAATNGAATEAASGAESVSASVAASAAASETGAATDAASNTATIGASLTEAASASDAVANGANLSSSASEAGSASDTSGMSASVARSTGEAGGAIESASRTVGALAGVSEGASAVDAASSTIIATITALLTEAGYADAAALASIVSGNLTVDERNLLYADPMNRVLAAAIIERHLASGPLQRIFKA